MIEYIDNPIFGVILTITIFSFAQYINKKTKIQALNPYLISLFIIIGFLIYFNIDFSIYDKGGSIISFFLGPATIALALPLYKQIKLLQKHLWPIVIGIFTGSLAGMVSIIFLSKAFNLSEVLLLSLIPKSITTAIAMEVSNSIGGLASVTIAFVSLTGTIGYIIAPFILKLFKIDNEIAQGISIGTGSHALGTAKAMEIGETQGAMSSLAISVAGIITVILAPLILAIMK